MKTFIRTASMLACCIFICLNTLSAADYKSKRTLTKSFSVGSGAMLSVENKFGFINIKEWDKNEVSFEITITATAKNQADADAYVKTADVNLSQLGSMISAVTKYENLNNCNCSRSVDYQIMVPKNTQYKLNNKYGNITMGNAGGNTAIELMYGNLTGAVLSGNNNINVKYGNIALEQLVGSSNQIETSYGDGVSITSSNILKIDIKYSKLKIGNVDVLSISSAYSKVDIQKVKTLNMRSKYENYTIGEAGNITGDAGYTDLSVGQLSDNLLLSSLSYGKLKIQNVQPQVESISANASYSSVDIQLDPKASCNVDLYAKYGNIKVHAEKRHIPENSSEGNTKQMKGTIGENSSPKMMIKIQNKYADINIKQ